MSARRLSPGAGLLWELIAIPSVNPAFVSSDSPLAGEAAVANYLAERAGKTGLDITWKRAIGERRNLLIRLRPAGKIHHRLLLAPHLDTVGADLERQFKPRHDLGRLYGRGACDTKGSIAAMMIALEAVAESGTRPRHTEIVFAGLVDEENRQLGSRALVRSRMRADLAIVGEPTQLHVVTAHKGDLWLQLRFRGRSAHGATPQRGINAAHRAARAVQILETDYPQALRKRRHPLLGCATINVGKITGGAQPNIVPDRCDLEIDRRTLPGESDREVTREIRRCLKEADLHCAVTNLKGVPCPPMETACEHPFVQQFLQTADQRSPAGVDFFCDAAILQNGGIPSVVFGPGNIAQAHTADEWIALAELDKAVALLERYLRALP